MNDQNRNQRCRHGALLMLLSIASVSWGDPCGMVPPSYQGDAVPITRVGQQRTYVFYKDGIETLVIRPGFEGKVDEFGMLIPFPSVPAIRKVPDTIFTHIASAIDPPEVVVNIGSMGGFGGGGRGFGAVPGAEAELMISDDVTVLKEEAVGMYEVAVLAAGSSSALSRWMDEHGYRYPDGMDHVCDEYIGDGWCFVAVKAKVGVKSGADPRPGQRVANTQMPQGSTFDGYVQAMGFRFRVDELVVPMRLSAFNDGDLHNVVYLLTDGPQRIRLIPAEYVVRQLPGTQLFDNVTKLLPVRIIGGSPKDVYRNAPWAVQNLPQQRIPHAKNGAAKELFAADLLAVQKDELALDQEETEKRLLNISERLGLRGAQVDSLLAQETAQARKRTVRQALRALHGMTLTVIDGDFPRDVLANQNLKFDSFVMSDRLNRRSNYDANLMGPAGRQSGVVVDSLGAIPTPRGHRSMLGFAAVACGLLVLARQARRRLTRLLLVGLLAATTAVTVQADETPAIPELVAQLADADQVSVATEALVTAAVADPSTVIAALTDCVSTSDDVAQRGCAIVALSEVGTLAADEALLSISNDTTNSQLVRTWAAAGRIALCKSTVAVIERAALIDYFPAVARPIKIRLADGLATGGEIAVGDLIRLAVRTPSLQRTLTPTILASGVDSLIHVMTTHDAPEVRRAAAGYVGAIALQGKSDAVAKAVTEATKFRLTAEDVPWQGGPLFIPSIPWEQEAARELTGDLIRWHVWCNRRQKQAEMDQISNNLSSLQLANAAGFPAGGRGSDTSDWLDLWAGVAQRAGVDELLAEQGLDRTEFPRNRRGRR